MMERPLMTPDELKSLPKGHFIVMKTGVHPMRVKLKLFFKWGIQFDKDKPYEVKNNKDRVVEYAEKQEIVDGIVAKYHPEWLESEKAEPKGYESGGQAQVQSEYNQPAKILEKITEGKKDKDGKGGSGRMLQEIAPHNRSKETEVNSDGQA